MISRTSLTVMTVLLWLSGEAAVHAVRAQAPPVAVAAPVPPVDPKLNFREKGRIGIIGAITEDAWKGGAIFEHEYFEAQILGHAAFQSKNTRDIQLTYKLGGRTALGTLNYLAYGAEFAHHPGSLDQGQTLRKDYWIGPYVSLQRYFAATPVMLSLWVNPVQYDHAVEAGENGHPKAVPVWRAFQSGGFGLAYLFH